MTQRLMDARFKGTRRPPQAEFRILDTETGETFLREESVSQERNDQTHKHVIATRPLPAEHAWSDIGDVVRDIRSEATDRKRDHTIGLNVKHHSGTGSDRKVAIWAYLGDPVHERDLLPYRVTMGGEEFDAFVYNKKRIYAPRSKSLPPERVNRLLGRLQILNVHSGYGLNLGKRTLNNEHILELREVEEPRLEEVVAFEEEAMSHGTLQQPIFKIHSQISNFNTANPEEADEFLREIRDAYGHLRGEVDFKRTHRMRGGETRFHAEALATRTGIKSLGKEFNPDSYSLNAHRNPNDFLALDNTDRFLRWKFPFGMQVDPDRPMHEQERWERHPIGEDDIGRAVDEMMGNLAVVDLETVDWPEDSSYPVGEAVMASIVTPERRYLLFNKPEFPDDEVMGVPVLKPENELLLIREAGRILEGHPFIGAHNAEFDYTHLRKADRETRKGREFHEYCRRQGITGEAKEQLRRDLERVERLKDHNKEEHDVNKTDTHFPSDNNFFLVCSHEYTRRRTPIKNGNKIESWTGFFKGLTYDEIQEKFYSDDPEDWRELARYAVTDTEEEAPHIQGMIRRMFEEAILTNTNPHKVAYHDPDELMENMRRRQYLERLNTHRDDWIRSYEYFEEMMEDRKDLDEILAEELPAPEQGYQTGLEAALPTLFIEAFRPIIEADPAARYMYRRMHEAGTVAAKLDYHQKLHAFLKEPVNQVDTLLRERTNGRAGIGTHLEPEQLYPVMDEEFFDDVLQDFLFRKAYDLPQQGWYDEDNIDSIRDPPHAMLDLNNRFAERLSRYRGGHLGFTRFFAFGRDLPGLVLEDDANMAYVSDRDKAIAHMMGEQVFLGYQGRGQIRNEDLVTLITERLKEGSGFSRDDFDFLTMEERKKYSYITDVLMSGNQLSLIA